MKKILIFTALLLTMATFGYSQEKMVYRLEYDAKPFEGIWIAKDGEKSYKMEFKTQIFELSPATSSELLIGSISFFDNGKLKRTIPIDDVPALIGSIKSDIKCRGRYIDKGGKCVGEFTFVLHGKNSRRASWEVRPEIPYTGSFFPRYKGYNENGFSIPTKLTFEKQK